MTNKKSDILSQNKIFLFIALATGLLLLVPLASMQFNSDVNWTALDFIVGGALIFGAASVFVLAARAWPTHRLALAIVVAIGFLYLWAELAVGIFTHLGS